MTAETAQTTSVPLRTAEGTGFTFYDIESLSNVFTLCAYAPPDPGTRGVGLLEMFFLADDDAIDSAIDPAALLQVIREANPGLPASVLSQAVLDADGVPRHGCLLWNLRREGANLRLAELFGLTDAENVCNGTSDARHPDFVEGHDPVLGRQRAFRLRPVCDTDRDYDAREHRLLAGYNSANYDTVMLALYLNEAFDAPHRSGQSFQPVRAEQMRFYNDQLFSEAHIKFMPGYLGWNGTSSQIRQSMMRSGRHLDVARLNELQQKVGLKRLLGMLGYQIKESEKLSHDTSIGSAEELYELLAYNVSDCLGLSQLFEHPTYSGNFDLKAGLLHQYAETVFDRDGSVRRDRLTIDSSSAKFVGRILAPHRPLHDIPAVSYWYPHPEIAAEKGIKPFNVLDSSVEFFKNEVLPGCFDSAGRIRDDAPDAAKTAWHDFSQVVDYYRRIEGTNFNPEIDQDAPLLKTVPKTPNNLPYYRLGGQPTSCFVTFSTGGIHGAEADLKTFMSDEEAYREVEAQIAAAQRLFPDPKDFVAEAKRQHGMIRLPDGTEVEKKQVVHAGKWRKPNGDNDAELAAAQSFFDTPEELVARQRDDSQKLDVVLDDGTVLHGKAVLANTTEKNARYREEPAGKRPELFVERKGEFAAGSTRLHDKYARASAGQVVHEDFTSYYPNLLRNMRAFYNPELGEDRYANIFFEKERLGAEMKKPGLDPSEKARLSTLRNGTKLILNSASGAGDASHRTPIRMNNRIISMRIIGQLFSWRIGQAQTLAGARIISTNTDGLYSVIGEDEGFDWETNNRVLAQQQEAIGIEIEPELMHLISKDSNNRLELEANSEEDGSLVDSAVIAAGGGSLACYAGPSPTKSLAHPAVLDFALSRYLAHVADRGEAALAEPFDPSLGRKVIDEALDYDDPVRTLMMFQNVIAASRSSITYPFAAAPVDPGTAEEDAAEKGSGGSKEEEDADGLVDPRPLQMVNRVFAVRSGTEGAVSLHNAGSWKPNPASVKKRLEQGLSGRRPPHPVAVEMLRPHGWVPTAAEAGDGRTVLPDDQEVVVRRINGIDPSWPMLVVNDDLHAMDRARLLEIIDSLDIGIYLQMLGESYENNWRNAA